MLRYVVDVDSFLLLFCLCWFWKEVTEEVNSWVEKQTSGLITNLLAPESVTPWTDSIFANPLFFNGRWDKQFDPSLTKDSDVYESFKVLDLEYRQGRDYHDSRIFLMKFYLPDEKGGLPAMLERLASDEDIRSRWAGVRELKIPRFKFGFNFEATKAIESLGLNLPLEKIFHKSCIEVDEIGSKAAAAAALFSRGACGSAKEKYDFIADHPFVILVKEYRSGLVLFLGQVIDPSMH